MKKQISLSLTLLCLVIATTSSAQEGCKLCGDWHGGKESVGEMGLIQFHIRIKKGGDKYYIKVKDDQIKNGETKTNYWDNNIVYSANGLSLSWENCSLIDNEWDSGERFNGSQIYTAKHIRVCKADVEDDVLHFQFRVRIDYYGQNGIFIGSEWASDIIVTHDMFKDDDDW